MHRFKSFLKAQYCPVLLYFSFWTFQFQHYIQCLVTYKASSQPIFHPFCAMMCFSWFNFFFSDIMRCFQATFQSCLFLWLNERWYSNIFFINAEQYILYIWRFIYFFSSISCWFSSLLLSSLTSFSWCSPIWWKKCISVAAFFVDHIHIVFSKKNILLKVIEYW